MLYRQFKVPFDACKIIHPTDPVPNESSMMRTSGSDWNLARAFLLCSRPRLPSMRAHAMLQAERACSRASRVVVQSEKTRLLIDQQDNRIT